MAEAFDQLLLPEPKLNWLTLGASFLSQALLVWLLVQAGLLHPERLVLATQHLTYTPLVRKTGQPEPVRAKFKSRLVPAPPVSTRLVVPRDVQPHTSQAVSAMLPPKVVFSAPKLAPALSRPGGAMPAIVHTGSFAGSSTVPTIVRPMEKVQTGGFGDPNGVPAQGKGQGQLVMAKMGAFDMPIGAGSGNGLAGARGAHATVASAGFGDGIAKPGNGDGRSGKGNVRAGGFGDAAVQTAAPQPPTVIRAPATTPVEILSKPRPVYTDEARRLGLQGEVLVQVLFSANGQAQVLRVVQGLSHGLDEAAVSAASKIRFKPAQQNGRPIDSTAVVHVVFALAY